MNNFSKSEAFYANLRTKLQDTSNWPSHYLYKFILKTDSDKESLIEAIFNNTGAVIETKPSKNGNYTSVSVNVFLENPDAVIKKYKEVASKVEGVISL